MDITVILIITPLIFMFFCHDLEFHCSIVCLNMCAYETEWQGERESDVIVFIIRTVNILVSNLLWNN